MGLRTTSSPASPKRLPRARGRSRAGGDVLCTPYVPIAPSQEWHGVASGEACGVYVRVCGLWDSVRPHRQPLPRGSQEGAIKSGRGCVVYAVRPHRPLPRVAWCVEWRGLWCLRACVWGVACRTPRLALHRAEQKETTDRLFPLFY